MREAKWLAGAFSGYGLVDNMGKGRKPSLFTSGDSSGGYIAGFFERAEMGRIVPRKGRWHWICDDPLEVKQFYTAVGPHLISSKREMIEAAWEEWRRVTVENDGEDPGEIAGQLYPEIAKTLHEADEEGDR